MMTRARRLRSWLSLAAWGLTACGPSDHDPGPRPFAGFPDPGADAPTASKGPAGTCPYPEGPYGVEEGQTLPLSLSWLGYRPGATETSLTTAAELYDCDGTRGIHALLFVSSQFGCEPCYLESEELERLMPSWGPLGVVAAVLLLDDVAGGPPTLDGVRLWKEELGLTRVGVYADPSLSLVVGDSVGTPMQTVVDPRTMKIVMRFEGLPDDLNVVHGLAVDNGG